MNFKTFNRHTTAEVEYEFIPLNSFHVRRLSGRYFKKNMNTEIRKNLKALSEQMDDFQQFIIKDKGYCYDTIDTKHFELYYQLYIHYKEDIAPKTNHLNSQILEKISVLYDKINDFSKTIDEDSTYLHNDLFEKLKKVKDILKKKRGKSSKDEKDEYNQKSEEELEKSTHDKLTESKSRAALSNEKNRKKVSEISNSTSHIDREKQEPISAS